MCENSSWAPACWLTDSYLENILKNYLHDEQVKITNVDIKPATSAGDNYASVMSRVKLQFIQLKLNKNPQEISLIIKCSIESDPFVVNLMSGYDVYNTEMKMYDQIFPQLSNILYELGDAEKLFPKTFKVDYEKSAIIFEDLSVHKYVLADRVAGLDETHARLVLKKLAKFHAAAAVLNQRLNGELEQFKRGILNRYTRAFGCLYESLIELCAKFAQECPELGTYYHDKLMKLKSHIVDYGTHAYNSNPNHFYTLCHGDLWTNNLMMLYNSEAATEKKILKDVLLIDFQFCNWSSVAVDLHFFFYSSLEAKIQTDVYALNKLVQYYHGILVDILRKSQFSGHIPTLHELHIQLEEGKILAFAAATVNQAFMTNDQSHDTDFHSLFNDDEKSKGCRYTMYQNKQLQNKLKILLPYFDQIGLLDVQK